MSSPRVAAQAAAPAPRAGAAPTGPAGTSGRAAGSAADADAGTILGRQAARESAARTYPRSLPVVPVRARGMTVETADGRRYLDCLSGAGALALGNNHPVVLEAIRGVLDSGAPLHVLDLATPVKDAFTEQLFRVLPRGLARDAKVQFCGPAGTDAVEAAIKLVRTATGRRGLLAFTGGFHGMTAGALAAGADMAARAPVESGSEPVARLPYPADYRCPYGIGGPEGAALGAHYIGGLLDDPKSGVPQPAGMLVEPVQGEGGVLPAPDGWLRRMRELTADRGIPLIADEVQTGVGRTGGFWGVDHAGVVPDVMVLAKAIGGSLPLAVIVYRGELDVWRPGAHTGTFRGNQLAMAAGTATLGYVLDNGLPARAAELGRRMLARLKELESRFGCVGEARGRGLMLGVELVDPEGPTDASGLPRPSGTLARAVQRGCLDRGVILELGGRHGAVVRLLPPLTMTDEQCEAVLDRLADAIAAVAAGERAGASAADAGAGGALPRAGGAAAVAARGESR